MANKNALINHGLSMIKPSSSNPNAITAQSASTSFNMLVTAWKDYKTVQAIETTKRAKIQADKEVAIKVIEEQSALLRLYFENIFAERKYVINKNFELLEQALEQDNMQMANLAMNSINHLMQQSPLAQAKELMANINNPQISHIEI